MIDFSAIAYKVIVSDTIVADTIASDHRVPVHAIEACKEEMRASNSEVIKSGNYEAIEKAAKSAILVTSCHLESKSFADIIVSSRIFLALLSAQANSLDQFIRVLFEDDTIPISPINRQIKRVRVLAPELGPTAELFVGIGKNPNYHDINYYFYFNEDLLMQILIGWASA